MKSERTTLFVCYRFPPDKGVGGLRSYKFAKANQHYRKSLVLTSQWPQYGSQKKKSLSGLETVFVPNWDLKSHLPESIKQPLKALRAKNSAPAYGNKALHGGWNYVKRATRTAQKLIKNRSVRSLYCSFQPSLDLEICSRLKQTNPDIKWVCDFRDYPDLNSSISDAQWQKLRDLIAQADVCLASTTGLARHLESALGREFKVLLSGRNPFWTTAPIEEKSKEITITYAGSLYRAEEPRLFIRDMKAYLSRYPHQTERLHLFYMGLQARQWETLVQEHLPEVKCTVLGLQDYSTAMHHIQKSDILLYFDWQLRGMKGVFGFKLWDYLYAGRPIVIYSLDFSENVDLQTMAEESDRVFFNIESAVSWTDSDATAVANDRWMRTVEKGIEDFWKCID